MIDTRASSGGGLFAEISSQHGGRQIATPRMTPRADNMLLPRRGMALVKSTFVALACGSLPAGPNLESAIELSRALLGLKGCLRSLRITATSFDDAGERYQ
jgi:hypothetical protein